jgi:hypothetical protein
VRPLCSRGSDFGHKSAVSHNKTLLPAKLPQCPVSLLRFLQQVQGKGPGVDRGCLQMSVDSKPNLAKRGPSNKNPNDSVQ